MLRPYVFCPHAVPARRCSAAADPGLPPANGRLFSLLPSSYTGVAVRESPHRHAQAERLHVPRNYYNGGGTAIGDSRATGCRRSC